MTKRMEVYKCGLCGNVVEMLHGSDGELVCCGQPMQRLDEQTADATKEKHVPIGAACGNGVLVKVGSVPHPMEEKHYIEWIEVVLGAHVCRKYLKPGEKPEAKFCCSGDGMVLREYCNVHGLWKG